jgi:hypothetical protein
MSGVTFTDCWSPNDQEDFSTERNSAKKREQSHHRTPVQTTLMDYKHLCA